MSARKSTVDVAARDFDRSAYRRPLIDTLSAAKLSLPMIRNLPSVEILTITWPLKTSCEVYIE